MPIDPNAITRDMLVRAKDGPLGSVAEVLLDADGRALSYLVVHSGLFGAKLRAPASLIDSVTENEVRLRVTREELERQSAEIPEGMFVRRDGETFRVPLYEERLIAGVRPVDLGEVRLQKFVDTVEEIIRQPVTRDDVVIERVAVDRLIDSPVQPRVEGDWYVLPVMEEVLVVERRLRLKEEIRIRTQRVTEDAEVRETRRRERIEIDVPPGVTGEVNGLDGAAPISAP